MGFIAALAAEPKPLQPASVKVYLHGLKHWNKLTCGSNYAEGPRVEMTMKGYTRFFARGRKPRLPITTAILATGASIIDLAKPSGAQFWAAITLCVFALLRISELLDLSSLDVSFEPGEVECMVITIKKSKKDQYRKGVVLRVYAMVATPDICPVRAVRRWLAMRQSFGATGTCLWKKTSATKALTRVVFTDRLRQFMQTFAERNQMDWDATQFSGHSPRRGGATSLYAAGVAADVIRVLGRWKSECYKLYLETPLLLVRSAQEKMAQLVFAQVWPTAPNAWDREVP